MRRAEIKEKEEFPTTIAILYFITDYVVTYCDLTSLLKYTYQ